MSGKNTKSNENTAEIPEKIVCPLCSASFTEDEARKSCSMSGSCCSSCSGCKGMITCPNCGYKIPGKSAFVEWISGLFGGSKKSSNSK